MYIDRLIAIRISSLRHWSLIGLCVLSIDYFWTERPLLGSVLTMLAMQNDDPFDDGDEDGGSASDTSDSSSEKTGKSPLTPDQIEAKKSVEEFFEVKTVDRSLSSILKTQVDRPGTDPKPVDLFRTAIQRGDWSSLKLQLAALPPLASPFVFDHMMTLLAEDPLLVPEDILDIADASATLLTKDQLNALGEILQKTLVHSDEPRAFLKSLALGVGQLGGATPVGRLNAARILFKAEMTKEAIGWIDFDSMVDPRASFEALDLVSEIESHQWKKSKERSLLVSAWNWTARAFLLDATSDADRDQVTARLLSLLPKLPNDSAVAWVTGLNRTEPVRMHRLVVQLMDIAVKSYEQGANEERIAALEAATVLGDAIATSDSASEGKQIALSQLCKPWLNESLKCLGETKRVIVRSEDEKASAIEDKILWKTSPCDRWIQLLAEDTCAMATRLKGTFAARNKDWETMRTSAQQLAAYDSDAAQRIANAFLSNVVSNADSVEVRVEETMKRFVNNGYSASQIAYYRNYYRQRFLEEENENGITLTRVKQVQLLKEMREWTDKLTQANLEPTPQAQAEAFARAHSSAEVFLPSDVESVFGEMDHMRPALAIQLVKSMRASLASQWRNQAVQKQAGTNRTDLEMSREVDRGYAFANQLMESQLQQNDEGIPLHMLYSRLLYDQSEFQYDLGSDLPTYADTQANAFGEMKKAASLYRTAVENQQVQPTIEIYAAWFQMALGASEPAYLTKQSNTNETQMVQLSQAIREFGEPLTDVHLTILSEALYGSLDQVPSHWKPRYLREMAILLGEHPTSKQANSILKFYDELLTEVEFHSQIDGEANVGHGQPFGMQLSVRYTKALGREAGYFAKLLQKEDGVDNQQLLEKEIREKLADSFEIRDIRFFPVTNQPKNYGREGWGESPLAYVTAASKDPAVDFVAPVQVDVLFRDEKGPVLLPIMTRKLLVDSKASSPPERPCTELAIRQTLDNRDLKNGKLRLEIAANGKGLIPNLNAIANLSEGSLVSGFQIKKIEDFGSTVAELRHEQGKLQPMCERTWSIVLEPAAGADQVSRFEFPIMVAPTTKLSYEQYSDTDIVATEQSVALPNSYVFAKSSRNAMWIAAWIGCGAIAVGLGWRLLSRRSTKVVDRYNLPEVITPFSVVAFLRRIAKDPRLDFGAKDREKLASTIGDFETRFFANRTGPIDESEFVPTFEHWKAKIQKRFGST
jgi:hypothetical protein